VTDQVNRRQQDLLSLLPQSSKRISCGIAERLLKKWYPDRVTNPPFDRSDDGVGQVRPGALA
jgi:hypothetical protein